MIVKISEGGSRWVLYDNAEQVRIDSSPKRFISKQELEYELRTDDTIVIVAILPNINWAEINSKNPLKANIIRFRRGMDSYAVAFSNVCYLCNDSGKTIERVG